MKIKAILFDADGVLFDARDIHYKALNQALFAHGQHINYDEHLERFDGKTTKTKLQMLTTERGLSETLYDEIFAEKQRITNELFETDLGIDESKIELLTKLKEAGYLVAICSNAIRASVKTMSEKIGIFHLLDAHLGNEDGENPKPAPDIYLNGAKTLGVDIKECTIVEDSETGMASARAAKPGRIVRVAGPAWVNMNLFSSLTDDSLTNKYSIMQRVQQDLEASRWSFENLDYIAGPFESHNLWPDSQLFLFQDLENKKAKALDFGCGFGRCIALYRDVFGQIDGTDISQVGLDKAESYLQHENVVGSKLFLTNGVKLDTIKSNDYDVVYSIICLQHIAVHDIRVKLMKEFYRVLKPGGWFTAQMGYSKVHPKSVGYYDNEWNADGTNGSLDCRVEDPSQLEGDLTNAGFVNFQHWLRPTGPADIHENWIFFRAQKPL